jgi:hypothetical protein
MPVDLFEQNDLIPKRQPRDLFADQSGDIQSGAKQNWLEDTAKVIPTGLVRGAISAFTGPLDLGLKGGQWLGNKIVDAVGAPRGEPLPSLTNEAYQALDKATGGALGYEPKTVPGEYARTISEFLPATLMSGGGNIAANAGRYAVVPAIASETAGQATKGSGSEPWARGLTALAAGGIGALNDSAVVGKAVPKDTSAILAAKQLAQFYERDRPNISNIGVDDSLLSNASSGVIDRAERIAVRGGDAKDTLSNYVDMRRAQLPQDLSKAISEKFPEQNYPQLLDKIKNDAQAAAKPAYKAAYEAVPSVDDPIINEALGRLKQTPYYNQAISEAKTLAALQGRKITGINSAAPSTEVKNPYTQSVKTFTADDLQSVDDSMILSKNSGLADAIDGLKKGTSFNNKNFDNGTNLTQWLKQKGGLQDIGGDLKSMDGGKAVIGLINNKGGMLPEDAALAAQDAGFLTSHGFMPGGERIDLTTFKSLIGEDIKNKNVGVAENYNVSGRQQNQKIDEVDNLLADHEILYEGRKTEDILRNMYSKGLLKDESPNSSSLNNPAPGPEYAGSISSPQAANKFSTQDLDNLTRVIRDAGEGTYGKGAFGGYSPVGRAVLDNAMEIRGRLGSDAVNPLFGKAVKDYADAIGISNAAKEGKDANLFGSNWKQTVADYASKKEAEQLAWRLGQAENLHTKINNNPTAVLRRLNTPQAARSLKDFYSPEELSTLTQNLAQKSKEMNSYRGALGNSATMGRAVGQAEDAAMAQNGLGNLALDAAQGGIAKTAIKKGADFLYKNFTNTKVQQEADKTITDIITSSPFRLAGKETALQLNPLIKEQIQRLGGKDIPKMPNESLSKYLNRLTKMKSAPQSYLPALSQFYGHDMSGIPRIEINKSNNKGGKSRK